ncbi:alcohol dehydrogenase catalytic domain-containing protein [Fodinicurvata sp. EGI_FJ10296]|uniref:zinc-dependent alcohol dehydrogenase n=1 Tax=Fodinicurvata sp. EGI_FJ10296 TaxID=3231908 RepID=UPI0034522CD0
MLATFIHGVRDIRSGTLPRPESVAGTVRIRVGGIGVCGSDLHYFKDGGIGSAVIDRPFVPGHEFAGWVDEDQPEHGLSKGQLVAVDPALPCGHCEWCRRGHVNLCPNVEFIGAPPHNGAMTELIAVRPSQVFVMPDGFSVDQAVMLEPLGVAIHAMDHAKPQLLETIAVLGCGPIGLGILQLARLAGAGRVYAIDPVDYRRDLALKLGADDAAPDFKAVSQWTNGRGADLVIEATNAPEGLEHAVHAVRIGGRLLIAGIPDGDQYGLTASLVRRKGLNIKFSRRMGHVYPRAIQLVSERRVDLDSMVTHHFPLSTAATAFEFQANFQDGAVKSVIVPDPETG